MVNQSTFLAEMKICTLPKKEEDVNQKATPTEMVGWVGRAVCDRVNQSIESNQK
jgi:hypothetical protein